MNSTKREYYPAIDGLRGVAVLSVIFFHLEFDYFSGGFVGVDIFFVISGYLITKNIYTDSLAGTFSYKAFYLSRIRRLFPALLACVLLVLILSFALFSPQHLKGVAESSIAAVFSFANIYFWSEAGYFDTQSVTKPLLHFWSLSVEEQFYLLWPVTLCLIFKIRFLKPLVVITVLIILGSLYANSLAGTRPDAAFYWPHARAFEFFIGALAVFLGNGKRFQFFSPVLLLISFGLIACSLFYMDEGTPFASFYALIPCLAAFLIIQNRDTPLANMLLGNKVIVFVGRISYSLYLVHWPVWVFYSYWKYSTVTLPEKVVLLALMFLLGYLLFSMVERRYRYAESKKTASWGMPFFRGVSTVYVVIFCLSGLILGKIGSSLLYYPVPKSGVECEVTQTKDKNATSKRCNFGSLDKPDYKVLVIGDSHAEQWAPGLNLFGISEGISFNSWTFTGCPPIWDAYKVFGIKQKKPPIRQELCKKQVIDWQNLVAEEASAYDAIVISTRWGWLSSSGQYGAYSVREDALATIDDSFPLSVDGRAEQLDRLLQSTIEKIKSAGFKKIIVFSQPPLLGRSIQACNRVPKLIYSSESINRRCDPGVGFEDMIERAKRVDRQIEKIEGEGVLTVIPSDHLCDQSLKSCLVTFNGDLLYRDRDHLNFYGSTYVIDRVHGELRNFITGSDRPGLSSDP